MRISERQLRGIINEEIRNRSLLNEQTDPATAAAQAKNVRKAGNVITWSDNEYDYKADISTGAMFTAKTGQPLKPVAAGSRPHTAIRAVASQLSAAPAAAAAGPTPAPGSPGCTLASYREPLTRRLASVGIAGLQSLFLIDVTLTGGFRGVVGSALMSAAARIRTNNAGEGIASQAMTAVRAVGSALSGGLTENIRMSIANLLNATGVLMKTVLAAQQKFTRTCDIRVFATDMGNAYTSFFGSFAAQTRENISNYIETVRASWQGIGQLLGMTLDVFVNLLSAIGALLAIGPRAVIAGISAALTQAGSDLTAVGSGRPLPSMIESRNAIRESAEVRRARNHRVMKQLAFEMYQVSRANQLLSEMAEDNRKFLIRSLI